MAIPALWAAGLASALPVLVTCVAMSPAQLALARMQAHATQTRACALPLLQLMMAPPALVPLDLAHAWMVFAVRCSMLVCYFLICVP